MTLNKENITAVNANGIKIATDVVIDDKNYPFVTTIDTLQGLRTWMLNNESNPLSDSHSSVKKSPDGWRGTVTLDEWYDVMLKGDQKVIKVIKESKEKTDKELMESVVSGYRYEVEGLFFDIGKVLSGEPECWLNPIAEDEPKEIIIKISTSANSNVDADDIAKGAGRILGIVNKLENDGFRVKLENWLYSEEATLSNEGHLTVITVKDFNDSINYAKMSAIVSPSLQRRGVFMIREQMFGKRMSGGYGRTTDISGVTTVYNEYAMGQLENKLFEKKD